MKTKTVFTIIILLFSVSLLFIISYDSILYPSYLSVSISCNTDFVIPEGISIAGQVIQNASTQQTTKVIYSEDNGTLKHEHCHEDQFKRPLAGLFLSCKIKPLKYVSEVECYTSEELPDKIYKIIYGDFK